MSCNFDTTRCLLPNLFREIQITLSLLHSKPSVNPDENADPSDGLMSMLKKMYSDGDDEMKRTINKAWSESQDKKAKGDGDISNMGMF